MDLFGVRNDIEQHGGQGRGPGATGHGLFCSTTNCVSPIILLPLLVENWKLV